MHSSMNKKFLYFNLVKLHETLIMDKILSEIYMRFYIYIPFTFIYGEGGLDYSF